jgi:valyl-tRNA synthetase
MNFHFASEVVAGIRNIRKSKNISFRDSISLQVLNTEGVTESFIPVISKLGNVSEITSVEKAGGRCFFIPGEVQ